MKLSPTQLLIKLGEAKARYRPAWRLLDLTLPESLAADAASTRTGRVAKPNTAAPLRSSNFSFRLDRQTLRQVRRREGRYLLRTHLCGHDRAELWRFYIQITDIEAAFKTRKDDLQLRPVYHQLERRIEAHIFVAFMAYGLHVTRRARLKPLAPGLTSRALLDKFAAIQMLDVHCPTTDDRTLILRRYTEPNAEQKLLLQQLNLTLPPQPSPKITACGTLVAAPGPSNVVESF